MIVQFEQQVRLRLGNHLYSRTTEIVRKQLNRAINIARQQWVVGKMNMKIFVIALAMGTVLTQRADAASFAKIYTAKTSYDKNYFGNANAPYVNVKQTFTVKFDSENQNTPVIVSDYSSDTGDIFANAPSYVSANVDGDIVNFWLSYGNADTGTYRGSFSTNLLGESPDAFKVTYNAKGTSSFFASKSASVSVASAAITIDPTTGAVPEPATWAMMMLGFGGMGYAMRRNKAAPRIRVA